MWVDAVVEGTVSRQGNTVSAQHAQVFTALGRFGQDVAADRHKRQAVRYRIEGQYPVAADGVQAALAVEGETNRRLRRHITGSVGAARQQFDQPRPGFDPADRFRRGW
ncbi:hypothetical protein D3C76_1611820 [compost metagenome]